MRNVLLIGAFVGVSASVPIVYQASPDTFHRMIAPAPVDEAEPRLATVQPTAKPATVQPTGRKARIEADDRGHYNADLRMNGRRVDAVIDTGATYLALNQTTARKVGVTVSPGDFRHEVTTANGKGRAALVRIDSLEIGRIRVDDVEALVLEDRALRDTLVGMNVLKALRKVEVRDGVMTLEQ